VTQVRDHWWWRPGWQEGRRFYTFHVTFGQQPGVQQLAKQARDRLKGFPTLDLVPGRWLHLTMQGVGFEGEVSAADLTSIGQASGRGSPRPGRWTRSGTRCAPRSAAYGARTTCPRLRSGVRT